MSSNLKVKIVKIVRIFIIQKIIQINEIKYFFNRHSYNLHFLIIYP